MRIGERLKNMLSNNTINNEAMKRYALNILALLLACGQAVADDALSVKDVSMPQGGTATVEIGINNTDEITALQFDLILPEGLSVATNEKGRLVFAKTDRTKEHSLYMQENEQGEYRVLLYSTNLDLIKGNSGSFMTLTLQASPELVEQGTVCKDLTGKLTGILLTQKDENRLIPADVSFTVSIFYDADGIGQIIETQKADGTTYDLSGRRVKKTVKGVYVKNNKKILVK